MNKGFLLYSNSFYDIPDSVLAEKDMADASVINLVSPQNDQDFFTIGRLLLPHSTCLKTRTAVLIVRDKVIISWGVNMCRPQGQLYGLPVSECPRKNTPTGGRYELCKPIHAEIVACIRAIGISEVEQRDLWHFPGFTLKLKRFEGFFSGATLYLLGHYWACQECVDFARLMGITEIKFDDLSGGDTLTRYRTRNLTSGTESVIDVSGAILEGIVSIRLRPEALEEFCNRHQLEQDSVRPFSIGALCEPTDTFLVSVARGSEHDRARHFKADPVVEEVLILVGRNV